jgi:tyrosyl-tRNA synthetase
MDLLEELEFRGLIYQVTNRNLLSELLNRDSITLYNGFDPTADSMTIGNLVPILLLRRFQLAGHHPIALIGGGTGLIGDPSGKNTERQLNTLETVAMWTEKFKNQLSIYLDFDVKSNPAQICNNYDWLSNLDLISFLRDVGKHFPINYMLAKESVSSRLEGGISFTEFTYMVLQSYDYLWLYENLDCTLQTGGSDQWGNITAGADLVRRSTGNMVFGLTCPLVTGSDGSKIGKTETGAIWLDANRTSPYQFYQYWLNVNDSDVVAFLKIFTFLTPNEILELEAEVKEKPWERIAQRMLAREVTELVHGNTLMQRAENISNALFYGNVAELTATEIEEGLNDVPTFAIQGDQEVKLVDLLARENISPSKRRAREDIKNGAISVNDRRFTDVSGALTKDNRIDGKYVVIRRGKSKYYLGVWGN